MPVKRSPSDPPERDEETKPDLASTPKKAKTSKSTPSTPTTPGSGWTDEKKAIAVRLLLETGYKHLDMAQLAEETGMSKKQCMNQFTPGRSNIRKAVLELFTK
ncbi:hypothetical protein IAU60_002859 [Kwoniella sp. DSM 27419]